MRYGVGTTRFGGDPASWLRMLTGLIVALAAALAVASFWPVLSTNPVIGVINVMMVVAFTATGGILSGLARKFFGVQFQAVGSPR
jgi:hypothetical protein